MRVTDEDRRRIERAHVYAWPALRTAVLDGWLWRASGGGSQRANSVSTVDFTGRDVEAAIDTVEARYRALGAPVRFQTFDHSLPAGLDDRLRARGYRESEATTTMVKRIEPAEAVAGVDIRDHGWDGWRATYLSGITESRRAINSLILGQVPGPRGFFGVIRNDTVLSTALCVVSFGCAVVECVATRTDVQRQGAGSAVMRSVEQWACSQPADILALQVVSSNVAAVGLYQGLGFVACATNRFWVLTD